ncbi:MAG: HlyD family secretion protein, partial [Candidatus Poribacteria bacterium]
MKNKWIIITIIVVIVLGLGGFLLRGKLVSATKDTANEQAGLDIKTAVVERGDISVTIDATGTIKPLNIIDVNSKASGKILELLVDAGDYVEKDEIIARIETTYVQVDVDQAKADLNASKARLEQAEINIQLEKEQSKIQITQSKEGLAESQKRLEQLEEQILHIEKQANARQKADAENNLMIAGLRYGLLTSATVRAEDIKRAESTVQQTKANLDLATKEYERKKQLFEKKYLSTSDLDVAETQWQSADAQYRSALEQAKMVKEPASEAELELAKADIKKSEFALDAAKEQIEKEKYRDMEIEIQRNRVKQASESLQLAFANRARITLREKDLKTAEAQLRRSESQLQLANESLLDTVIRAPISGTILEKRVEEGQVIFSSFGGGGRSSIGSSEGTTLATMADLSKVYVVTEVDETDIGKVRIGQPVTITVEAFPDQPFEGEVLKIAPQGQVVQNVTTFEVITELKNTRSRESNRWGSGSGRGRGRQRDGGFSGEGGGGWAGRRASGESITPEQRERWQAMRRQRSASESADVEVSRQPSREVDNEAEESSEDGDLWSTFFDDFLETEEEVAQQSLEEANTPFLKPGMNATV